MSGSHSYSCVGRKQQIEIKRLRETKGERQRDTMGVRQRDKEREEKKTVGRTDGQWD